MSDPDNVYEAGMEVRREVLELFSAGDASLP